MGVIQQAKHTLCTECDNSTLTIITYEEYKCNHILHLILSIFTFFWLIIWAILYNEAKTKTENSYKIALAAIKCKKCQEKSLIAIK